MPYAPGIQNISGELLAQGMRERAQGVAGGLVNWIKGYEQNQALKNQGVAAFSGLLGSDPDFQAYVNNVASGNVQVPAAVSKAIKNYQNGDIDVYDAAILGNTGQAFSKHKSDVVQRQTAAASQAHLAAQTQLLQGQIAQQKRVEDFLKNVPLEGQLAQQPQMEQPSAPAAAPQAVAQPSYGVSTPSPNVAVPSMLSRFVTPPAAQQPTPPPQLTAFLPQPGQGMARPSSTPTRQDLAEAALENPMGNPTIWSRIAAKKAEDRQKAYMSESVFTGPEGLQKAQAKSDEKNRSGDVPEGLMWAPKFSESAKGFYPELREKPKTREEQAALAQEITKRQKLAEASIEDAKTFLGDINASAAQAIDDKARFDRIRQLYSKKAESGKIADWTLDARSALAEVGLGDRAKTAGEQELRGLLALGALQASKRYYKGQGSTSNEERNRIDQVVEAYKNGQVTNEALIQFAEAHNRKLVKASQLDLALTKQKIPLDDRGIKLREWWLANPVNKFMGDGTTETYELNDQGIMVKAPAAQPSAAAPSAQAGTPTQQPISIGRFKVIQVK